MIVAFEEVFKQQGTHFRARALEAAFVEAIEALAEAGHGGHKQVFL
jgi:hypothetical protein